MVIFDCDGVLVDSEVLLTDVHVTRLRKLGLNITHAELTERFLGVTDRSMHAALEADLGAPLPDDYDREVKAELRRRSARELRSVPGASAALRRLHGPCCVASSSAQAELEFKLDATGLAPYFAGNVFSADVVAAGKPAPDIFLYAARAMRVDPAECLVIEDSLNGVKAAVAAGMEVIGFMGASHLTPAYGDRLLAAGARGTVGDFGSLTRLVPERFVQ